MPPAATLRWYSYNISEGELPGAILSKAAARIVRLRSVRGPILYGVNSSDVLLSPLPASAFGFSQSLIFIVVAKKSIYKRYYPLAFFLFKLIAEHLAVFLV